VLLAVSSADPFGTPPTRNEAIQIRNVRAHNTWPLGCSAVVADMGAVPGRDQVWLFANRCSSSCEHACCGRISRLAYGPNAQDTVVVSRT
jgi:hypothetical protein